MPATMRILGWKAEGLRCPDHEINFVDSNDNLYPISIIQMPNGTGKTTTLALLRAALSGSADNQGWGPDIVSEYRKKHSNIPSGIFEVRLLLNDRRATIVMAFDFENGLVSYKSTHGPGHREGFYPPPDFRRFMNKNFVNFYVFDGELAQHLLDKEFTDAQVVVENLFQMNAFDQMKKKVEGYWENRTQNDSASEKRGLSRRQNRLRNLKQHLANLKRKQKRLHDKREELESTLKRKEDIYDKEIDKEEARSKALSEAKDKVGKFRNQVRDEALDALDRMRDPHALSSHLAMGMLALKDGLDKVKLPESAAREFFEDLALEAECVCGREIDEKVANTIRNRAVQYLGTDDVSLLNSIKSVIKEVVGDNPTKDEINLANRMDDLSATVRRERDARNDLDSLMLEAEQSDPAIKRARLDIESLRAEIRNMSINLEKFESKDQTQNDEQTYGIEIIEKRISDAENKLAQITKTLTEKEKRDILTTIIDNAHRRARRGITTELCDQANSRISELMPHNKITINRIEKNLILKEQEGGSSGETLSIAYAFLATLFNRSEYQLPFVVDSPANPIDLDIRPKIGQLIPNLSEQFIAFTISSERDKFIEPLKNSSKAEIQFVTIFRKRYKNLENEAKENGVVLETHDGFNVVGESFFNLFQLEEERD